METAPPRGTQDFVTPDGPRLRALYDRAAAIARLHGYRYVETPGFEASDLFSRTSGETSDVVAKEMYTFQDRGERWLTLRPEGTAPVVRAYLHRQHDLGAPYKAYYLTRMYRYARPQAGRFREHRQFGIEVMGTDAPGADVEVIALGDRFLRDLGLAAYRLEVNSIGDATCRPAYRDALVAYLDGRREDLHDEHRDRYRDNPMRVLDCKDEGCRAVAAGAPRITDHLCDACGAHFAEVREGLHGAGLDAAVTPTLVRGLDYYTRTAFEFVADGLSAQQGTLFGGGRYDGLAEALGGPHVPGVGFGMGLERVALALEAEGVVPPEEAALAVYIVAIGDDARDHGRGLLTALRDAAINADMAFEERPLKAQLKLADRARATYAAIVGDREVADGTVTLRRMADGVQETVLAADVVTQLAEARR
jgi:histidyl-tRNA synthetase